MTTLDIKEFGYNAKERMLYAEASSLGPVFNDTIPHSILIRGKYEEVSFRLVARQKDRENEILAWRYVSIGLKQPVIATVFND